MADLLLYGVIGDPDDGLDSKTVTTAIRQSSGLLNVRINSPGGLVTEGMAIVAALRAYPGKVITYIDGLAASMGSVIAMVGAEVIMAESALLMVHKPSSAAFGTADEMRSGADQLDMLERQCVAIYAQRTGLPDDELARMLAAETWMDAGTALDLGFITSIAAPLAAVAMAKATGYGFRHLPDRLKEPTMTTTTDTTVDAVAVERQRVSAIMALASKHNIPAALMQTLVTSNATLDAARERMLDHLAAQSDGMNIGHMVQGSLADPTFAAKAMGDALYAKMSGKAPEGAAREMMGLSMVDMARTMADYHGVRGARTMRPEQVLNAAAWNRGQGGGNAGWDAQSAITHTTGDFPDLLTHSGHRFLLDVYQAAASPLKLVGRQRTATDFRPIFGLQLSNFGTLSQVNEAGEIKHGTFTTRKNSYQLATFAKQFSLTRQAIINDDLGAFSDIMTIMGRAAAETEAAVLAALLASNPLMDDGKPLFDAAHGNYATGTAAAAPTVASLSAARLAMRTQKDMDGVTPINSAPKYILTGPALETAVEQLLFSTTPPQLQDVNPFAGKLTPLVDPRITGNSWELFADPALAPSLEYANLNGASGPNVEQQNGWDVLGQAFRVYHDFGAGFVDYRGAYRNDGAAPA